MIYKGVVKNNQIHLDPSIPLTDGTEVEIIPIPKSILSDPICGSWKDDRNADEIIQEIREARYSKKRDIDL